MDKISILKISKMQNSIKNVGGVIVIALCTSSDDALYLYHHPCFKKISPGISELFSGHDFHTENFQGHNAKKHETCILHTVS